MNLTDLLQDKVYRKGEGQVSSFWIEVKYVILGNIWDSKTFSQFGCLGMLRHEKCARHDIGKR